MDIKQTDNTCDLKCKFNFNYTEVTLQSLITPSSLNINLGTPSVKPVKFNDVDYTPYNMMIIYPSDITYDGVQADANVYIRHRADLQKELIVSIPITISSITKPLILNDIIKQTAELQPKTQFTNLNIPSFSLEQFVPKGPFYYSENKYAHIIYYGLNNSISMSNKTYETFKQIIVSPYRGKMSMGSEFFYNPSGSNLSTNGGSDFNFLECDEYYEMDLPESEMNVTPPVFLKLLSNPSVVKYLWYIFYAIISGIILYTYYKLSKLS